MKYIIIGYSTSRQKDWKKRLKNAVLDFNLGVIDSFCLVTTNATFSSDYVQGKVEKVKEDIVLLVDEAHNFGAYNLSTKLPSHIPYRLALSATMERFRDPEGTEKLIAYFGKECINYSLERAINEKKLTPYYYYPVLTFLSEHELAVYRQLTIQLSKFFEIKNGRSVLSDIGKKIAIKRARLVAGSVNKLFALEEKIYNYESSSHMLVYCGATTVSDVDYLENRPPDDELRQITAVSDLLGNKFDMKVSQFTSRESAEEREVLKREFSKGDNLQALVAIRCLDEGVNIPKIKTAFILASSTNPKEYIQRRGRVLRLAEGKKVAEIYDFISVPRELATVRNLSKEEVRLDLSLVRKEIQRMEEFASISKNPQDAARLISKLKDAYRLDSVEYLDKGLHIE